MCNKYFLESSPELKPFTARALSSKLTGNIRAALGKPLKTEGEVRPGNISITVAPDRNGKPKVYPMVWGFANSRSDTPQFNMRSEVARKDKSWKGLLCKHRCVIPASYFYAERNNKPNGCERRAKEEYLVQTKGKTITYLAGMYTFEEAKMNGQTILIPAFTILTREPSLTLRGICDRMPVLLPEELVGLWVSPDNDSEELLKQMGTEVYFEKV